MSEEDKEQPDPTQSEPESDLPEMGEPETRGSDPKEVTTR